MATEYQLEADTAMAAGDLFGFLLGEQPDAVVMDPDGTPYLRLPGMDTTPFVIGPDDPDESENRAGKLGFQRRVLIIFRMRSLAEERERAGAERQLVHTALAFFAAHPGNGVLLHNNELVIVEQRDSQIAVNSDWDEFFDEPWLVDLIAAYPRHPLAQPLM